MILVDTNIWVAFFDGKGHALHLERLLNDNRACLHPWVFGELTLGYLGSKRNEILLQLGLFPHTVAYPVEELRGFIETEQLCGKGLSLVDVQLLYTSMVNDYSLWTADQDLHAMAKHYKIEAIF